MFAQAPTRWRTRPLFVFRIVTPRSPTRASHLETLTRRKHVCRLTRHLFASCRTCIVRGVFCVYLDSRFTLSLSLSLFLSFFLSFILYFFLYFFLSFFFLSLVPRPLSCFFDTSQIYNFACPRGCWLWPIKRPNRMPSFNRTRTRLVAPLVTCIQRTH